jgi:UDP-glucose 4-epimerase
MLKHGHMKPVLPVRVVVLGASGFVAAATLRRLEARGVTVLGLPRTVLDLTRPDAGPKLAHILRPNDALLFVSAKAPVRSEAMLIDNLRMAAAVCEAIRQTPVKHMVYVSSDAVYADSDAPLTEYSCAQPASLHGVMHLAREVMLAEAFSGPLCFLRPTLIYGAGDPHNGYGPNRFMRLAAAGLSIELFGDGDERRDHIWIEDVAEVATRILLHESRGVVNVATGEVISFSQIAHTVCNLFPGVAVTRRPRVGVMPHNGYRPFDTRVLRLAFPDLIPTSVRETLPRLHVSFEADRY